MAQVHLPRSLVDLFPGAPRLLTVEARSVAELLQHLEQRWPGMWDRLCETGPAIRVHINVFVDGQKATLETAVAAESVVRVIPAVSGG